MKRTGFLMEVLATKENALQAIAEINEDRKDNKTAQWVERTKEKRAEELCEIVRDFRPKPPRTFQRYDPAAGRADPVYLYDGPGALYGFTARDGTLTCQAADSPNEAGTLFEITLDL